ncbi:hypothetical protein ACIQF6_35765 [Kitasatospora sp. NPDC092948]|uniref:hypothetical protein n=1 Tax=Kitasatospora sp. NPDC092948 TaxID=3364088 RepID=UPI00381AF573
MNRPTSIHAAGCGCDDCHRPDGSIPLDQADEAAIARLVEGAAANDSGEELEVVMTTTLAPGGAPTGIVGTVVVRWDGRTWDVSRHLLAAVSFGPPF